MKHIEYKQTLIKKKKCLLLVLNAVVPLLVIFFLAAGCSGPRKQLKQEPVAQDSTQQMAESPQNKDTLKNENSSQSPVTPPELSAASQLLVKACNNYLTVNPDNPKAPEVLTIKGSLFYNNRMYDSARTVYHQIIERYKETSYAFDAIRMVAQAFYEEKKFDEAQVWYKRLSEAAPEGVDKTEALARIAESIFRMAEVFESENRFKEAAEQYERVALEYPDARIADVALFNAGLAYEKRAEWSRAILVFQRLHKKYDHSKLLPKSQFRIAKCHEKLLQWDLAAETYIRLAINFPESDLSPVAMYNAGFSFENGNKLKEAAATFEKMVQIFPQSEDAADVLFRAGELYGKLKDWESVARVTKLFTERFGNDESRVVQALCMAGIAMYMRNHNNEATTQLERAVATYRRMKNPGEMNAFYAAKALYTIAEINHTAMNGVALGQPRNKYKKQLSEKSEYLDKAIDLYINVLKFNLSDWTTRSLFQIGQAYEDFAIGIFSQQRPSGLQLNKQIAFELGVAKAVEKYFMGKAVTFHERNVKLGIKEKIEDKYILQSRQKLTYLPYLAAENYLALVEISRESQNKEFLKGFALIARKLQMLQKMAPFQEKAITLFLRSLELGTTYQIQNEFYNNASTSITEISLSVGETYSDVVSIAREAPIPDGFDEYERFVYKTKLLKQIEDYEDQAFENYLKTIKIAEAYNLQDQNIATARERIGRLLFNRGRCYDLLCINAFEQPPFPQGINEAEKEEYKVRFEEIGLRFQEQAFEIYKNIITLSSQKYASGEYVTHAYIRLFQNFPEDYGVQGEQLKQTAISSGSHWKVSSDSQAEWFSLTYSDSAWEKAQRAPLTTKPIDGFPGNTPIPMWFGSGNPDNATEFKAFPTVYFRRTFTIEKVPHKAELFLAAQGVTSVYFNGKFLRKDTINTFPLKSVSIDLMGKIRQGLNSIAIKVATSGPSNHGLFPILLMTVGTNVPMPQPPGFEKPMPLETVRIDNYRFPPIKNFTLQQSEASR